METPKKIDNIDKNNDLLIDSKELLSDIQSLDDKGINNLASILNGEDYFPDILENNSESINSNETIISNETRNNVIESINNEFDDLGKNLISNINRDLNKLDPSKIKVEDVKNIIIKYLHENTYSGIDFTSYFSTLTELSQDGNLSIQELKSTTPIMVDSIITNAKFVELVSTFKELNNGIKELKNELLKQSDFFADEISSLILKKYDEISATGNYDEVYNELINGLKQTLIQQQDLFDATDISINIEGLSEMEKTQLTKKIEQVKKSMKNFQDRIVNLIDSNLRNFNSNEIFLDNSNQNVELNESDKERIKSSMRSIIKDQMISVMEISGIKI